jgi:hypothetical protein
MFTCHSAKTPIKNLAVAITFIGSHSDSLGAFLEEKYYCVAVRFAFEVDLLVVESFAEIATGISYFYVGVPVAQPSNQFRNFWSL